MKIVAGAMMGAGLVLAAFALSHLSSDAIGMAIGMTLGVLSGVPTAALVLLARRRDSEDDGYCPPYGTSVLSPEAYYLPPTIDVAAEDVTPYYNLARRALGEPPLPSREAQIAELRQYLAHLESQQSRERERRFMVRWESEGVQPCHHP